MDPDTIFNGIEFYNIKGFSKYHISKCGKILSDKGKRKILKRCDNGLGYKRIKLCKDGRVYNMKCSRLVAQTFIPNPENKPEVNHKDFNRSNDCVDNLEWVSKLENEKHKWRKYRMLKVKAKIRSELKDETELTVEEQVNHAINSSDNMAQLIDMLSNINYEN